MDWKKTVANIYSRSKKPKKSRRFKNAYGYGFGPTFPCGTFDMSSVPGGADGAGDPGIGAVGDGGGFAGEAVDGVPNDSMVDTDDLMMSDNDRLVYALRGIIENAKIAYEAVTGVPYEFGDDAGSMHKDAEEK